MESNTSAAKSASDSAPSGNPEQESNAIDADLLLASAHGVAPAASRASRFAPDPPGDHVEKEDGVKTKAPIAGTETSIVSQLRVADSAQPAKKEETTSETTDQSDKKRPADSIAAVAAAASGTSPTGAATQGGVKSEASHPPEDSNKKARRTRSWDEFFGALASFKAINGHCNVPVDYREDPELAVWVREQHARRSVLSPEERYKLDLIGSFEAAGTVGALTNQANFAAAAAMNPAQSFAATLGSFGMHMAPAAPQAGPLASRNIFSTLEIYKQRQALASLAAMGQHTGAQGLLSSVALGQTPLTPMMGQVDPNQQQWNFMYQQVESYFKVHGEVDTLATSTTDASLRLWMLQQKNRYRSGTMPEDRLAKLKAVKFVTDSEGTTGSAAGGVSGDAKKPAAQSKEAAKRRVRSFDENFNALLEYKNIHGNVDVPQKYDKDRKLGIWVKNVRQHPNRHSEEQRARLDAIGFKWRKLQLDDQWTEAFKQLLEYRDKYGDCNVPSRWKTSPALARWVHTQRTMYRRNKLLDERKEKLEEAGFVWDCNAMRDDEAFHENYEKLVAFKTVKGHCNIPNKYRRDRPLGRWASKMRDLYAADQLDADRKKALNDIGFAWKLDGSGKKDGADGGQDTPEGIDGDWSGDESEGEGPIAA
ncbi:helicase [Seminavis robusta]|uniref:Helicase n=1 Tax=Seminavis robusta TaxID=568900 RepID=A0A9N8HBM3_9STRA|nr:helicase [Seminavis robusta]|eukprot:Sro369_g128180.1 helicase (649) ;mRNA; f:34977-37112